MACGTSLAKSAGLPVYQLLAGKSATRRIKLVVWARDVPGSRLMAEQHLKLGVSCVKVKTGLDPESDIARVRAVREVAGRDIPVTNDANCGWTIQQAKYCLRQMADANLLLAEQPIPAGDPVALAELRRDTPVPIMADESVFTLQDAWLLSTHAPRTSSVSIRVSRGIAATAEIIAVAKAAACVRSAAIWKHGTAAMLHVAAAFPEVDTEAFPPTRLALHHEADLITPVDLGPLHAKVPDGPGLGVELTRNS